MTSFRLKLLALSSMIIDHTGVAMSAMWDTYYMRLVGRLAFPLYAFLIAEGCRRTRDIKKYMLRLAIFALFSEVPFDLLIFKRPFDMRHQNIFFTLLLGVAAVTLYRYAAKTKFAIMAVIPMAALAELMKTDYGALGVLAIYLCYLFGETCSESNNKPKRAIQALALAIVLFFIYDYSSVAYIWALAAIVPIALYNGHRGCPLKLVFYFAYPLHLIALVCVRYFGGF